VRDNGDGGHVDEYINPLYIQIEANGCLYWKQIVIGSAKGPTCAFLVVDHEPDHAITHKIPPCPETFYKASRLIMKKRLGGGENEWDIKYVFFESYRL